MKRHAVPTREKALKIVSPIAPEIYHAFEYGGSKARDYFEAEKLDHDGSAYALIVRMHAREYLKKRAEFATVIFDRLSMCGISFLFNNWKFRLWKSADHRAPKLPHPGHSEKKQRYYVQPRQMDLFSYRKRKKTGPKLHLVILWNLDKKRNLETLWLVCPEDFNPETGEIKVHWIAEIPNPILAVEPQLASGPAPALPLELRKIEKTKEG